MKNIILILSLSFFLLCELSSAQCTGTCTVNAGTDKTSLCVGGNVSIGVSNCSPTSQTCSKTYYWTPANLVVSGQGTCTPTVNPTVTTNFVLSVTFSGNCCCSGVSGSCGPPSTCDSLVKRDTMKVTVIPGSECRTMNPNIGDNDLSETLFSVTPNPSSGIFTITRKPADNAEARPKNNTRTFADLYDQQGNLVKVYELTHDSTQIDISEFARGVYFIRLFSGEIMMGTQKVIYQ